MKKIDYRDWIILTLVFLLILISSSLFRFIDETAFEPLLPWPLGALAAIGAMMSLIIHAPVIFLSNAIYGAPPDPHGWYATTLPFLTAGVYTAALGAYRMYATYGEGIGNLE